MFRLPKILLLSFIGLFTSSLWALPGDLDTTFGGGTGWASTGFQTTPVDELGQGLVRQSDGKLVIVGTTGSGLTSIGLARFNTNGTLDTTFGNGGKVQTLFGANFAQGRAIVQQGDGKLVVAGSVNNGANQDFLVVRYNTDGSLDTTFGGTGKVSTAVSAAADDYGYAIALQSDGKLVVAGSALMPTADFALVRYNTDGTLDTTFGTAGKVTTPIGTGDEFAYSVIIQADNKIVAAGKALNGSAYDFALVRYTSAGVVDTTFNTTGKVVTTMVAGNDIVYSVIQQADGMIVAAGPATVGTANDFAVARYTTAGVLDATFGTAGKVTTAFTTFDDTAYSVIQQIDGKLVVAGYSQTSAVVGTADYALARYTTAGVLDTTFGVAATGKITTPISVAASAIDQAWRVIQQPDGNLVAAGYSMVGTTEDFSIVRYTSAGALDTTFNTTGKATTDVVGKSTDTANAVIQQADGKLVVAGVSLGLNNDFSVARYNSDGTLDTAFDTDGKLTTNFAAGADIAYAALQQADGKLVVAGVARNANDDFALVRYNVADGSLDTTFGGTGKVTAGILASGDVGRAIVQQGDGKLVVAGYTFNGTNYDFALARFMTDGTLDTTFNTTGKVTTAIGAGDDKAYALTLQSDGKIVAAGYTIATNSDFALIRYNTDGSLDTTFGTGGKVVTAVGTGVDEAWSVIVQPDGKIVAAGLSTNTNADFAIVRYNGDGTLDTTFGTAGMVSTNVNLNDQAFSLTRQSDGKFVAAGFSNSVTSDDFALIRYNTDGSLDTSFGSGGTGKVVTAIAPTTGTDRAFSIISQADNKLVVAGYSTGMTTGQQFSIARYLSGVVTGSCSAPQWWNGSACVDASAGNYVNTSGATSQTPCAAGTYQPSTGQTSCIQAPAGSFAAGTGNISSSPCAAGSYSSVAGQAACTSASAGNFVVGTGATAQTACSSGTYQSLTGQTSCVSASAGSFVAGTAATSQTACAAGSYQPSTGQSSCISASVGNFVATTGATSQAACAAGSYQPSTGQSSCISASVGNFVAGTAATSQTACAAGSYQPSTGQSSCISASVGNFVAGTGATSQTACAIGHYQPSTGQSSCLNAPAGSFVSGTGATSATQCTAGNYQPLTGQSSCTAASAGNFVAGVGAIAQTACAAGSYQSLTGQTSCTSASAGNFVASTGASSQTACLAGTFQPLTGQTSCTSAPAGSFAAGPGATGSTLCAAGTFSSTAGQASCTAASTGNFVASTGATSQTACAAGNYQSLTGQTSCTSADAGSFVAGTGASSQTACAAGTYQPLAGQTSCTSASAGSFVAGTGAIAQTACAAGTFQSLTGQSSCTAAPAGSFVVGTGATSATQCAAGSYQPSTGQTSCILASANFFVATAGQTAQTACPGGTSSPPGATSCSAGSSCLAGQYWNSTVCVNADPGNYVPADGAFSQIACAAGTYQPIAGQTSCTPAPAGRFVSGTGATSSTQCAAGTYQSLTGQSSCTPASTGNFVATAGATAQTACAAGSYQSLTGQTSCTSASAGNIVASAGASSQTACAAGTYQPSTGQVSCINAPAGSFVGGTGATSSTQCAVGRYQPLPGQASCTLAAAGNFVASVGAIAQTACAAGTFQSLTGQSSCTQAPAGSFVSGTGATSSTQCAAGNYQPLAGQSSCTPAAVGNFVASAGATAQTACAAGSYQSLTGQTSCTPAPAGSYATGPGATSSTQCAAGSYQPLTGQASCTLASAGFYVPSAGATSQIACAGGTTSLPGATVCITITNPIYNDFDGDNRSDILMRNNLTGEVDMAQLNGMTILSQGVVGVFSDINQVIVSTGDFDGNKAADILTRGNATSLNPGRFRVELTTGQIVTSAAWMDTMSTSLNDVVMSTRDFDNDGKSDVLLRNKVTGVWTINYMHGTSAPTIGTLNASTDLCYTLQGVGDYDGNGFPDLLLRRDACGGASYPWLVQTLQGGFTVLASGTAPGLTMNIGWAAMITDRDFNGDGKTDVLMRDRGASPQLWLEYDMNGVAAPSSSGQLPIAVQSMWQFAAEADFNGDGRPDILIRSVDTGQWYAYLMSGRSVLSSAVLMPGELNPVWSLQALDDNNGDGKSDILIRHDAGGAWYLSVMNGLTPSSQGILTLSYDLHLILQND